MRYIKKGKEPNSLTEYKKQSNAYFDGYPQKDDVREKLLEEQGYLCAYCMRRLSDVRDVKIEHVISQNVLADDEKAKLEYSNMVGVCYGNEKPGRKKPMLTCDAHKGEELISVNPLDENSIRRIKYLSDGTITSDDADVKKSVEETLNLNYNGADAYLVSNRKEVLNACKAKLTQLQRDGLWTKSVLVKILNEYEKKNEEGKCIPYSGIAIDYLNRRLHK